VAEFGLLDAQLAVLLGVLQAAEEEAAAAAAAEVTVPAAASASGTPSAVSFEAMDVNGDGAVSRDEFEAWKQQQQQQQQQRTEGTPQSLVSTSASNGVAAAASASTKASVYPVTGPTMDALVLSRIDADELEVVTRQVTSRYSPSFWFAIFLPFLVISLSFLSYVSFSLILRLCFATFVRALY